jgi:glycosyltransferase involved in cell wall biosynthesis
MVTLSSAALLACKLTGTKAIGIVTDIPGMIFAKNTPKKGLNFFGLHRKINFATITRYSGYLLLTRPMNSIVNPENKPYMVMEGLVDTEMGSRENLLTAKDPKRIIIYAGGLFEKYGIKDLIEAFMQLPDEGVRLHLYGVGLMVDKIKDYCIRDARIVYKGMVPNETVVVDQLKATLLVNPRPTDAEYTKYSFPSKNMEYMVSGTPTLTTILPGMPEEYKNYVYLINEETTEGIYRVLSEILSKSSTELHEFGLKAKTFVLENKNKRVQAERILTFLDW